MSSGAKERRGRSGTSTAVARRKPTGPWSRGVRRVQERWRLVLAWDPFWIVLFLAVTTLVLAPSRSGWQASSIELGSIAARDFVAPDDALFLDEEATETKRARAREDVLPVYDLDPGVVERVGEQLSHAFAIGRQLLLPSVPEAAADRPGTRPPEPQPELTDEALAEAIRNGTNFAINDVQVALLRSSDFSSALEDQLRGVVEMVLTQGVVAGKSVLLENRSRGIRLRNLRTGRETRQLDLYGYLDFPAEVREQVTAEIRGWRSWRTSDRNVLVDLVHANLSPNLHPNPSETQSRQEAASDAVEQVYNRVRQGQVVVRKGDQIDARTMKIISEFSGEESLQARLLPLLGIFLFLALLVLLLWLGVRREGGALSRRDSVLGEILLLFMVSIVCAKVCYLLAGGLASTVAAAPFDRPTTYYFAIPFGALGLLTVLLYGRGLALLVSLAFSVLAGLIVGETSWAIVVYCLAGSLAAILTVDALVRQRSILVRAGGVVGLINVATLLMLAAVQGGVEGGGAELGLQVLCGLLGGMLVAAVVSFAVPVLESLYPVTTGIKLIELANTNLPLLRRLAFEAPGTFQHSLMVANLAKAGCDAIQADSVLAYTGALYHDIGKMFRPEYFVENQRPGENRHDKLLPSMSALIIINHVKEGLELAREYHLPEPILDAIAQHHGSRLISYFFKRAQERHDPESGELSEDKFRYPGPRPDSKVMGVLMLADGVEAASRTLIDPSPVRLRSVIKAITDDCLRDGQLDETDLTLGDLNRVAEAFQRVLTHIHHRRLDYPGFDFNAKKQSSRGAQAAPDAPSSDAPEAESPEVVAQ